MAFVNKANTQGMVFIAGKFLQGQGYILDDVFCSLLEFQDGLAVLYNRLLVFVIAG